MTMTGAAVIDPGQVRRVLARRAAAGWAVAIVQIACGLLASIAIPALLATWLTMGTRNWWGDASPGLEWAIWYAVAFLLLVPTAYLWEWFGRSGDLIQRIRNSYANYGTWGTGWWSGYYWRWDAAAWALEWELVLFAPRMVFEGIRRIASARFVGGGTDTRAAEILCRLLEHGHGLPVDSLKQSGDDAVSFNRAMAYLVLYDWVGVSGKGEKAWAHSETREKMGLARE